jgi:hypothetical protein
MRDMGVGSAVVLLCQPSATREMAMTSARRCDGASFNTVSSPPATGLPPGVGIAVIQLEVAAPAALASFQLRKNISRM